MLHKRWRAKERMFFTSEWHFHPASHVEATGDDFAQMVQISWARECPGAAPIGYGLVFPIAGPCRPVGGRVGRPLIGRHSRHQRGGEKGLKRAEASARARHGTTPLPPDKLNPQPSSTPLLCWGSRTIPNEAAFWPLS